MSILGVLEHNKTYVNQNPKCEPQLGRRGLYTSIGGQTASRILELAMLWVLNCADGCHTLLDIADKADLEFGVIREAADALSKHNLLKERL